jgi:putative drug exporter of the RND superfamily
MTTFVGMFCFRHRWLVVMLWLAVVTGGMLAAGTVFERLDDTNQLAGTESGTAREVLKGAADRGGDVIALWEGVDPRSPILGRVPGELAAIPGVKQVQAPVTADNGKGVAIEVDFALGDNALRRKAVDAVSERLRALAHDVPGTTVRLGGSEVMGRQINAKVQDDLNRAEFSSLPATVVVMVIVFAGLLAAGVPLLATLATVSGAFAVLLGFSEFLQLDANIVSVVSMMGLALCIDYSLLLIARYREELGNGLSPLDAVRRAWATAGRTIAFSALTVIAGLAGLLFIDVPQLAAMGAAGISAAVVALLSALTLTAALLGLFGRRIRPPRRLRRAEAAHQAPGLSVGQREQAFGTTAGHVPDGHSASPKGEAADGQSERGFFARLAAVTQARPVLFALGAGALLLALGTPLLHATVTLPDMAGLPRTIESVAVFDELAAHYGRNDNPAVAVVARAQASTLDGWAAKWAGDPAVTRAYPARAVSGDVSIVSFAVPGDSQSGQARDLVTRMRADRPTPQSWVTGDAAVISDLNGKILNGLPLAAGFTIAAMFVLLFLMTGSLVVPVKALLMNIVSLGATFGVLVAVFEKGWLSGPLHTLTVGGLSPFVMVLVFAFGFGLSMDYEVFLLARIKEGVDAGEDTDLAVRRGLQRSGRIITSAALLMLIVFGFFAAAEVGDIEQIGLGLFVAVLVDATIVRCLLVPATMTLLGRWNWWAPQPLRRLHSRVALREQPAG